MSITTTYPFTTPANYTYNTSDIEVSGGVAKLKNQSIADLTFYVGYDNSSINADVGLGYMDGTAIGGASVASGMLDLTHDDIRYVDYEAKNNADNAQQGSIIFDYYPNYTGNPSSLYILFSIFTSGGNHNEIIVYHDTAGALYYRIVSDTGAVIFQANLGAWSPTINTKYTFEVAYDITSGASRLFIDGVQLGATQIATGTRVSANIDTIRIGQYHTGVTYKSNFRIDNFQIYSTVQNTANYTVSSFTMSLYDYCVGYLTGNDDANDHSKYGNSVTTTGTPNYTTANIGNGFDFDGSGSFYFSVGAEIFDIKTADFAVAFTLNPNVIGTQFCVFDKGTGGTVDGYGCYISAGGNIEFHTDGAGAGGKIVLTSATVLSASSSYNIVLLRRAGVKEIWVNGIQDANTQAEARELSDTSRVLYIGREDLDGDTDYTNGITSQIMFFKKSLSSSEISIINSSGFLSFYATNPTIKPSTTTDVDGIISMTETVTKSGNDDVKYTIEIDGNKKYWDGSAWSVSSGYSQSNTIAEINTNLSTLDLTSGANVAFVAYIHSGIGTTTPEVDKIEFEYNFHNAEDAKPLECIVNGYILDAKGDALAGVKVEATPNESAVMDTKNYYVPNKTMTTYTDSTGYMEIGLVRSSEYNPDATYEFIITTPTGESKKYSGLIIPDQVSIDIKDLWI